ncbi:DUF3716 domain-containing protein [Corallococcus carmarthensis]|uniref:DUF3716 domain-containing protein n=1 Tax=Corallococcus carmarthensis TaxID=2316728 RepID=A0A3A8KFC5_9BACT|nr:DUF3716 domain-containing protein [Corallococcus carmarthensis]
MRCGSMGNQKFGVWMKSTGASRRASCANCFIRAHEPRCSIIELE